MDFRLVAATEHEQLAQASVSYLIQAAKSRPRSRGRLAPTTTTSAAVVADDPTAACARKTGGGREFAFAFSTLRVATLPLVNKLKARILESRISSDKGLVHADNA